jgi:hypothetical protein
MGHETRWGSVAELHTCHDTGRLAHLLGKLNDIRNGLSVNVEPYGAIVGLDAACHRCGSRRRVRIGSHHVSDILTIQERHIPRTSGRERRHRAFDGKPLEYLNVLRPICFIKVCCSDVVMATFV